jgi:hypothetical protein
MYWSVAFRFMRVKDLQIEGVKIKGGIYYAGLIQYCQDVWVNNIRIVENNTYWGYPAPSGGVPSYQNGYGYSLVVDVCRYITISNCTITDSFIESQINVRYSKNVKILDCTCTDAPFVTNGVGGIDIENDSGGWDFIQYLPNWRTTGYRVPGQEAWGLGVDDVYVGVVTNWDLLVNGCTSHRNGHGLILYHGDAYGNRGVGCIITNNVITANAWDGINVDGDGIILENNIIRDNGWNYTLVGGYGSKYPPEVIAPPFD